jgi:hypothetical protein
LLGKDEVRLFEKIEESLYKRTKCLETLPRDPKPQQQNVEESTSVAPKSKHKKFSESEDEDGETQETNQSVKRPLDEQVVLDSSKRARVD